MKHPGRFFLLLGLMGLITLAANAGGPSFVVKKEGHGRQSILFLPGFACSGDVWKETVAVYSPHYTCYMLTMPGFAGAPPEQAPVLEDWVTQVADYIRQEHLEKPVIVGHSLGGVMALLLAGRYPELIGRIVVVDALPCLSAAMNPGFHADAHADCSIWGTRFSAMNDSAFYRLQKQGMRRLLSDTVRLEEVVGWSMRSDRQTLGKIYCQLSNLDLRDRLQSVTCPALILLEAPFTDIKETVEGQYKGLAQARLLYAGKGLHFIMYDDPQWYREQLTGFLPL